MVPGRGFFMENRRTTVKIQNLYGFEMWQRLIIYTILHRPPERSIRQTTHKTLEDQP
jgi:hypothetical protein